MCTKIRQRQLPSTINTSFSDRRRALQSDLPPPARCGHNRGCGAGGSGGREPISVPAAGAAAGWICELLLLGYGTCNCARGCGCLQACAPRPSILRAAALVATASTLLALSCTPVHPCRAAPGWATFGLSTTAPPPSATRCGAWPPTSGCGGRCSAGSAPSEQAMAVRFPSCLPIKQRGQTCIRLL